MHKHEPQGEPYRENVEDVVYILVNGHLEPMEVPDDATDD